MPQRNLQRAQPRLNPERTHSGFFLLHTLILVLIGGSLAAIVFGLGVGRSRDFSADVAARRMEMAAESGVRGVLASLIAREQVRADTLIAPKHMVVDGFDVEVEAQFSDGLIGLRSTDRQDRTKVLSPLSGRRASSLAIALEAGPTISSYAELAARDGIGIEGLVDLLPYVTLFSGSATPNPEHTSQDLRALLGIEESMKPGVIQSGMTSLAGSIMRIRAVTKSGSYRSRHLLVEVMITGRTDHPLAILEWFWVPARIKN